MGKFARCKKLDTSRPLTRTMVDQGIDDGALKGFFLGVEFWRESKILLTKLSDNLQCFDLATWG